MANINIDYAQLTSTASQLQTGQQNLEAELNRLRGLVGTLVSAGFKTDQASGKFDASYAQWTTGTKNVVAGLEGMRSYLQTVINQHQQLDTTLGQSAG